MKKILITGADGFIGSHLTEELVIRGYDVKAFTFYNSLNSLGWIDNLDSEVKKSIEIFPGDIRDAYLVRKAMENCDRILHLAALIAIPYSYNAPNSYIETNIVGTLNILQAAKDSNINKIVHTSTSEVYGTAQYVPITEDHPLNAQSPYAASKIGADQLCKSFFNSFNMPISIIRPFNTFGPRQSARAIIPTIIIQIIKNNFEIKLGSVTPTRNFNFVKDTVEGFIKILESEKAIGEIINIGSEFEITIENTTKLISKLMNKKIKIISDNERIRPKKSEVQRLCASNKKAKELINWSPDYIGLNGFKKGLLETISWFLNLDNINKYKPEVYNL